MAKKYLLFFFSTALLLASCSMIIPSLGVGAGAATGSLFGPGGAAAGGLLGLFAGLVANEEIGLNDSTGSEDHLPGSSGVVSDLIDLSWMGIILVGGYVLWRQWKAGKQYKKLVILEDSVRNIQNGE